MLRSLGTPYTEEEIGNAVVALRRQSDEIAAALRKDGVQLSELGAHSEAIALIAYLQRLGRDIGWRDKPVSTASLGEK